MVTKGLKDWVTEVRNFLLLRRDPVVVLVTLGRVCKGTVVTSVH